MQIHDEDSQQENSKAAVSNPAPGDRLSCKVQLQL